MSAIGSGIGDESPHSPPSATDKRKHAEIGDGSPQSPPPPMEKRERVENMERLSESMPAAGVLVKSAGDEKCDRGKGSRYDKEQERMKKFMEKETAFWKKLGMKFPVTDDDPEEMGRDDGYRMQRLSNYKENHQLHDELMGIAKKVVAYYNHKNNQNFCFIDFKDVASCLCCGNNLWLTIKVDADPVMFIKSKCKILRPSQIEEDAGVEIEECKFLSLAALSRPPR